MKFNTPTHTHTHTHRSRVAFTSALIVLASVAGLACRSPKSAGTDNGYILDGLQDGAMQHPTTNDMNYLLGVIREIRTQDPNARVLTVFDIDNTLLKPTHTIASDEFFNVTDRAIKEGKFPEPRVNSFQALLDVKTKMLKTEDFTGTELEIGATVREITNLSTWSMVLTSRSPTDSEATLRELHDNALFFVEKQFPFRGATGEFAPVDAKLDPKRTLRYQDGVMMSSGQNKGEVMRFMIASSTARPTHVVFVDDTAKHLDRMHTVLDPLGFKVHAIRYTRLDGAVKQFEADPDAQAAANSQLVSFVRSGSFAPPTTRKSPRGAFERTLFIGSQPDGWISDLAVLLNESLTHDLMTPIRNLVEGGCSIAQWEWVRNPDHHHSFSRATVDCRGGKRIFDVYLEIAGNPDGTWVTPLSVR